MENYISRALYKKKRKKRKIMLISSISFLIILIGVLIGWIYFQKDSFHHPKLEDEKIVEPKNRVLTNDEKQIEKMKKLYEKNSDFVGWITIADTKINYPVMYTKGEDYYLYRDFYKKKYNPGTLFIDKHNNVALRDINLIIHGHNMDDGSMFHDLEKYKQKDFYLKHKTFTFYTTSEKQIYEIISVFKSKVYNVGDKVFKYYKFYDAKNTKEYNYYISNIKKLALYHIDTTAEYPEELLTLSTCEYSQTDGRLVIVAKKIN